MGIDRFQRARDTGSIYAWVSQSNDPFHYTYEPHQWNAEFEPEIRMQDDGIDVVTLYDFERHAGGWGANHNSYRNASFTMPNNMSSYDTSRSLPRACMRRTKQSISEERWFLWWMS